MPSRLVLSAALLVVVSIGLSAQAGLAARLGTTDSEARDSIFSSFATGIVALAGQRALFKEAAPQDRALMARGVIAMARAFTGTAEFATRYRLYRATQQPVPAAGARTGDEARAEQQKQIAEAIRQATQMAGQVPPEVRKELEQNVAEMQKQIAELNADPEHRAAVDAAARDFAVQAEAEHKARMAEFEQAYPADVPALVARRLREFLDACADVDYGAALAQSADGKYRFVNPALEQKPAEWKMCYRAGKPAVDAARSEAQEWLNAIGR